MRVPLVFGPRRASCLFAAVVGLARRRCRSVLRRRCAPGSGHLRSTPTCDGRPHAHPNPSTRKLRHGPRVRGAGGAWPRPLLSASFPRLRPVCVPMRSTSRSSSVMTTALRRRGPRFRPAPDPYRAVEARASTAASTCAPASTGRSAAGADPRRPRAQGRNSSLSDIIRPAIAYRSSPGLLALSVTAAPGAAQPR